MDLVFLFSCSLFVHEMLTMLLRKDPHNSITCKKKLYCVQKEKCNRFVLVTTQDTYQINILYLSFSV